MNVNYPKEYRDNLNRVNYILHNEFEKTIYTFYGDTNKIKVKYIYYRKNIYFDVFSKSGDVIFSNVSNNFLDCKVEKKYDGTIDFIVHPVKRLLINQIK
jgi:hypothetical protein